MKKKLTKNEKGITLVALIITIIVLLILAVVSIRAITGDNILGKSETAKEKYQNAQSEENNQLGIYEQEIDKQSESKTKITGKLYQLGSEQIYILITSDNKWRYCYKDGDKLIDLEGYSGTIEDGKISTILNGKYSDYSIYNDTTNKDIENNCNKFLILGENAKAAMKDDDFWWLATDADKKQIRTTNDTSSPIKSKEANEDISEILEKINEGNK